MQRLGIALVLVWVMMGTAAAQTGLDRPRVPSVTVSGETSLAADPDQAEIDLGVGTQARNAPDASRENAEKVSRVLAEVKKILDKADEVKTSGYALTPNYRYPSQGGRPEITGYTASNMLRIKMVRLENVGKVIDSAMQAGANNINRLVFTLKNEEAARLEALKQASAKAKAKAEAIAASLGLKIVKIISVTENERSFQPVFRQMAARAEVAAAPAPTPVEPGTVEVRSTVSLVAELSEN